MVKSFVLEADLVASWNPFVHGDVSHLCGRVVCLFSVGADRAAVGEQLGLLSPFIISFSFLLSLPPCLF